jgi:hypothetical protein
MLSTTMRRQADFFCGKLNGITFPYSSGFVAFFLKLPGTKNSMITAATTLPSAITHPTLVKPHAGKFGSRRKDKVELLLWRKVCVNKTMTLDQAKTDYLNGWTKLLP